MVDILQAEGISRYYHAAWADDADGTNFSLAEYDGAVMIGTYNDDSGTESTDPTDYNWQIIGAAESDGDGDPTTAAAENEINALTAAVDDLTARTLTNAGNIDTVNDASITGIGQPNLLTGTNRGADGWTGSGFTLAAETGTVYNETDTPITWLKATCVTPGALSFTADGLRAVLADDSDTDTYTLSCDLRMSTLSAVNVSMSDADGTNTQIDFGTADNASEILDDLHDLAGTWVHHSLTAQIVDGNTESAQVLLFDCSNMTAGDTVEIANLKVEGGAIATPWKASADEAMNAANEALSIAGNTNQYFWHTETGSDTGAHITEIPKDDFITDPTNGGGNLLARSNGIAVRDGLAELATFGASGAQIGQSGDINAEVDASGFTVNSPSGTDVAHLGYGSVVMSDGTTSYGPYYTLGFRQTGAVGYVSAVIGAGKATKFQSVGMCGGDANGERSIACGASVLADSDNQAVFGKFNESDANGTYAFIIGNGAGVSNRSNAFAVDWNGNIYPAGVKMDDYVTEQDSSGNWRYRKWHSGKIEAWFEGTFSCAASTTARGALYYSTWTLSIPSSIGFSGTPNTLIGNTGDSTTVISVNGAATSATAISGKVWRYASSSSALTISSKIYAWQD